MKLILFILTSIFLTIKVEAQDRKEKINLIISVDYKIVVGAVSNIKILSITETGDRKEISADYYPGCLSIPMEDYLFLTSDATDSVAVSLTYTEFCKGNRTDRTYEIDLRKGWLKGNFYILYIYNTDKKIYKKQFSPLKGKNYTYEIVYPGGGVSRVKKTKLNDCQ